MFEKIGDILIRKGYLDKPKLQQALSQNYMDKKVGEVLISMNMITEDQLTESLAEQAGVDFLKSDQILVADEKACRLVSEDFAKANRLIPISIEGNTVLVAMADTEDIVVLDNLKKSMTGKSLVTRMGGERAIAEAIERMYVRIRKSSEVSDAIGEMEFMADPDADNRDQGLEVDATVTDSPIVKLVNLMLSEAIKERATDVHVEPEEKETRVRYRVDGVLVETMRIPNQNHPAVISRIKIISKLNIAERRLTQDGRFTIKTADREVDVRVSILPTVHGEKVVMRLLDKSGFMLDLRNLGFRDYELGIFSHWIQQPYGMVIISGPTGSGKSTTLYAALTEIKSVADNITTVEDPVEYQVPGINQVQVREKIGLTFAAALRSILRQDPDTLLLGEIRDHETADMAIKFALTGHLVFSTLHANDAPTTITRYIDLGIPPFLVGSCLNLVMAQRLVRTICKNCKTARPSTPEDWLALHEDPDKYTGKDIYYGKGCPVCRNSGFRGRSGIFEILEIRQDIRKMIYDNANQQLIREKAIANGMIPLRDAGIARVLDGTTALSEVKRATVEDF
jgi:type IV pilus assembly protein PilB